MVGTEYIGLLHQTQHDTREHLEHGRPDSLYSTQLLSSTSNAVYGTDADMFRYSTHADIYCRYLCRPRRAYCLHLHDNHILSRHKILQSTYFLVTHPAFCKYPFSCNDLDICYPILAWRTYPMERAKLSKSLKIVPRKD